ncbi:MAG: PaaI family thioesterase [Paracoccaceae bacterium]
MSAPQFQALCALVAGIPYLRFLGLRFELQGDDLRAVLPFDPCLIGNPMIPALHGGVTAAFLETTAIVALVWQGMERHGTDAPDLPRTIDLTVDYLRAGASCDAYARARILRAGRRYASVQVEAWQDDPARPFAQGTGHFLMPRPVTPG